MDTITLFKIVLENVLLSVTAHAICWTSAMLGSIPFHIENVNAGDVSTSSKVLLSMMYSAVSIHAAIHPLICAWRNPKLAAAIRVVVRRISCRSGNDVQAQQQRAVTLVQEFKMDPEANAKVLSQIWHTGKAPAQQD